VGDLGDVLILLDGAVLVDGRLPGGAGSSPIARSSAPVMAQPQVNSTWRRDVARDSKWVISSWLAPAPSIRISSRTRKRAGDLAIAAPSTAA
jgi:hypothetical protein